MLFPMLCAAARRVLLSRHFSCRSLSGSPEPSEAPTSLSARLSFVFDQIDALDRERAAKDQAIQRIRSWHVDHRPPESPPGARGDPEEAAKEGVKEESMRDVLKREVELLHPWPEWIEFMERLAGQKYFDFGSRAAEETIATNASIDLSGIADDTQYDFSKDWTTVRNACMNFGRDRFDILRSLSKQDIRVLVGHGCPSLDPKVVFSAKLLRKHAHLDEGDVCSSCSVRNICGRGYILTRKEDEARTLDVVRILLTYGFDHFNGTVENKELMKMKSIKTVVRKLLHEVVKLSAVPIDPNLPPPVIKKAPPKVKQPPPPPKKRVGRDDVEMKKGDWLCPKCDFMNFAKNIICLQCDAKRPKRQLLPGEWECPKCNFLNYRRNMSCFQCEHKRPPDEFMENQMRVRQSAPRPRQMDTKRISDVSDAWNFNFDDNESDGADVAAFEFADSPRSGKDSSFGGLRIGRESDDDFFDSRRPQKFQDRERLVVESSGGRRDDSLSSSRTGFDDFDDEEDDLDNYELDMTNRSSGGREVLRKNFSDVDTGLDSEELDDIGHHQNTNQNPRGDFRDRPQWKPRSESDSGWSVRSRRGNQEVDDDLNSDFDDDEDDLDHEFRSSKKRIFPHDLRRRPNGRGKHSFSDEDLSGGSESDSKSFSRRGERNVSSKGKRFRSNEGRRNSFGSRDRDGSLSGPYQRSKVDHTSDEFGRRRDLDKFRDGGRGGFNRRPQDRRSGGYSDMTTDLGYDRPRPRRIIER